MTIVSMIDSKRGETSFTNNIHAYFMNQVQGIFDEQFVRWGGMAEYLFDKLPMWQTS